MSRLILCAVTSAVLIGSGIVALATAQDAPPAGPTPEQQAEMVKAWEAFAAPGEEHRKFAELAGEWTCKVEDFSMGQPMVSEGHAKFSAIMDGRYLMQEFSGSMAGVAFKGMGLTGYNNATKKFQEIWIDSMGTAIFFAEGTRVDEKTTESKGKMTMPGMGEIEARTVSVHPDKDHMEFSMHMPGPDGKEVLAVKITYTRK